MPDPIITNNKARSVNIWDPVYADDQITFAGIATLLAGTILARDSVSGFLVPYVIGGVTNENGIPKALIRDALTSTAAGEVACRVIVNGRLRKVDMVVDADGDASNINKGIEDELRDYGLVPLNTKQLATLDNQ